KQMWWRGNAELFMMHQANSVNRWISLLLAGVITANKKRTSLAARRLLHSTVMQLFLIIKAVRCSSGKVPWLGSFATEKSL
ncbi:MAG: hypothetical protein D6B25_01170, partial [Desulfobulbaceae bacterium]